jgi:hypothetical protein
MAAVVTCKSGSVSVRFGKGMAVLSERTKEK